LGRAAAWAGPVITTLLARLEHTLRRPGTDPTRPAAGSEPPDRRLVLVPDGVLAWCPGMPRCSGGVRPGSPVSGSASAMPHAPQRWRPAPSTASAARS
jgi:hypothetical protein